jgi:dihydrofolate reductase
MSHSVLYMSMSVDGYIAAPNDGPDNPGGDDFMRLHSWMISPEGEFGHLVGPGAELIDEFDATGAVVVGRRTFEQAGYWNGDHHDGVPIFVLSRQPQPTAAEFPAVTYVSDGVETAMAAAKAAAGDRNVLVHGAYTGQRALEAGVLDEIQIHQIPVLFGDGLRLFDVLPDRIELDIIKVIDTPDATHIRYRVRH